MATLINPAPAAPTGVLVVGGTKQITINWTPCDEIDYAGTIIQISTSSGGTYTAAGEVLGSSITISGLAQSTQYFVKLAHYDRFGKTGLNWSSPAMGVTDNFNSAVDARIASAVISGSQLLGNSVPASALSVEALYAPLAVIGDVRNLVRNSLGDNGTNGWTGLVSNISTGFDWASWSTDYHGKSCLVFDDRDATYGDFVPVSPGDQFWVSCVNIPRGGANLNYTFSIGVAVYDKNKTPFNWISGATRPTSDNGYKLSQGSLSVTHPDAVYVKPWIQISKTAGTTTNGSNGNGIHVSAITVTRKNKGELIVDGTLTGNHIAANSITANNIDTRNLTIKDSAGNVLFGSGTNLDYSKIVANSAWLNSNITVNATGYLVGAGSSVQVANSAISTGTNLVYNSDFSNGSLPDGWSWITTTAGISTSDVIWGKNYDTNWYLSPYSGKGTDVAYIQQPNIKGNASYYIEISSQPIPVVPNQNYVASGYTGSHRCKSAVFAYFYDSSGAVIGNTYSTNSENNSEALGGNALSAYKRVYGNYTAPNNAAFARIILRKYDTSPGNTTSWLFVTKVQLEAVGSTATTPGPWCDSGILDNTSVRAVNPINAGNISTYIASAAIGNAQIDNLDAAKITTGYLAAERVDIAGVLNLGANNQTIQGSGTTINKYGMVVRDGNNVARVKLGNLALL